MDHQPVGPRARRAGNLAESVYGSMRRAILDQALPPGVKLPEDQLGEVFGVSRTVIRSVLARLVVEGLVEQEPNKRAAVATPSLEEGRDVFVVRRGLERMVVEAIAGRLAPTQIDWLRGHVERERDAQGRDGAEAIRLSGEFHLRLAELTGNDLLTRYVSETVSRCSLILALYGRPHSSECAVNEHQSIVDALERGDAATAIRLMDTHLAAVASRALLDPRPDRERDLKAMLAAYRPEP